MSLLVSNIEVFHPKSHMYFLPLHATCHVFLPFTQHAVTVIISGSYRPCPSPNVTAVISVHPLMIRYVSKPLLCVHQLHASFKCVCLLWPIRTATVASICDNGHSHVALKIGNSVKITYLTTAQTVSEYKSRWQ
jgi:hypothetical protein